MFFLSLFFVPDASSPFAFPRRYIDPYASFFVEFMLCCLCGKGHVVGVKVTGGIRHGGWVMGLRVCFVIFSLVFRPVVSQHRLLFCNDSC